MWTLGEVLDTKLVKTGPSLCCLLPRWVCHLPTWHLRLAHQRLRRAVVLVQGKRRGSVNSEIGLSSCTAVIQKHFVLVRAHNWHRTKLFLMCLFPLSGTNVRHCMCCWTNRWKSLTTLHFFFENDGKGEDQGEETLTSPGRSVGEAWEMVKENSEMYRSFNVPRFCENCF